MTRPAAKFLCQARKRPRRGQRAQTYVEPHLAEDPEIACNAGNHTEVVRMAYKDFERLAHPHLVDM